MPNKVFKKMPIIKYNMNRQIEQFYQKNATMFKTPLEKIINKMLLDCKYINGESLERHNFGDKPIKLTNLPSLDIDKYEEELIKSLKNAGIEDKSIIELLWGDIQLGKRIHACIIMWISVYILKRPVLYIFRNLKIDKSQLMDDISGVNKHDFNIIYIRKIFEEFTEEISEEWKEFKLPELKDIDNNDNLSKLSNKDKLDPKDILCCLMNHIQLEKINNKLTEYIKENNELINLTIITDESDLYAPSASNDNKHDKDILDATKCEKLLASIYLKVRYVLHITGTAHSLLYNTTTRLNEDHAVQLKISKVHKMNRTNKYYGLFNNNINYNTDIDEWWDKINPTTNKKYTYNVRADYQKNIISIISQIKARNTEYSSLLISEEKIRKEQFELVNDIISDFKKIFLLVFHGKCLRLYIQKKYIKKLLKYSEKENRLFKPGGIFKRDQFSNIDNMRELPNNYHYINIDEKIFNIKQVYKLLSILIKDKIVLCNTVITITGKYGERGYSFTSDDYDKYSFHITDQYFPCHVKTKNCTDISQRLRIQGKYNDNPNLILWTTHTLQDIMESFYIPFMKNLEQEIMDCETYEEIRSLIEGIIDTGEFINFNYMKYIGPPKYKKNIKSEKRYDSKHKGYRLFKCNESSDENLSQWCSEHNLPTYDCINEIKNDLSKEEFIEKYKLKVYPSINYKKEEFIDINEKDKKFYNLKLNNENINTPMGIKLRTFINKKEINSYKSAVNVKTQEIASKPIRILNYINRSIHIFEFDKEKYTLSKITHIDATGKVLYSKLKSEYQNDENYGKSPYYWKTPDGWLYLHHPDKPPIMSISIKREKELPNTENNQEIVIDKNIRSFKNDCIGLTEQKNLRIGINELIQHYKNWCISKNIPQLTRDVVKKELIKLNIKEEPSKGVNKEGKSGKRGYNIVLINM